MVYVLLLAGVVVIVIGVAIVAVISSPGERMP